MNDPNAEDSNQRDEASPVPLSPQDLESQLRELSGKLDNLLQMQSLQGKHLRDLDHDIEIIGRNVDTLTHG